MAGNPAGLFLWVAGDISMQIEIPNRLPKAAEQTWSCQPRSIFSHFSTRWFFY